VTDTYVGMATDIAGSGLLERQQELEQLDALLSAARRGDGSAVVIEGSAGIGKSALIQAIRDWAASSGLVVLHGRGTELEREFSFGVARQLLEPALSAAAPREREALLSGAARHAEPAVGDVGPTAAGLDPSFAVLHGLFWLVSNLSERTPLVLAVDDVQWSDSESLRFLAYLIGRLEGMPILVALGARTAPGDASARLLAAVRAEQASRSLRLRPLSEAATADLVRDRLGAQPEPEFAPACHRLTGGNPQLIRELLAALAGEGLDHTAESVAEVAAMRADRIASPVLARLGRLGEQAVALARAVAILGTDAPTALAGALAELEPDEVESAARALVEVEILRPGGELAFTHDIGRDAVYKDIPASARAETHRAAAALLEAQGAGPEAVAAHVVARPPADDAAAVGQLLAAAASATSRGAPDAVIAYLERALEEQPARGERVEILTALGRALTIRRNQRGAAKRLYEALGLARTPARRAEIAHLLAPVVAVSSAAGRAVEILERELEHLADSDRDLGLRVESDISSLGFFSLTARRAAAGHRRRYDDPDDPRMLASAAMEAAVYEGTAERASSLARRAVEEGRLLRDEGPDSPAVWTAGWALVYSHDLRAALRNADDWVDEATRNGSLRAFALTSLLRSRISYWLGDLAGSEADARAFVEAMPEAVGAGPAFLGDALIEQGRLADAHAALVPLERARAAVGWSFFFPMLLYSLGILMVRNGSLETGLERLQEAGRAAAEWELATPGPFQWRPAAAEALAALGEREEARRLIEAELESCERYGSPMALGIALRAAGVVEAGEEGTGNLALAVSVLSRSEARLERARALIELGATLRRTHQAAAAREPLREGLAQARACGATPLAERAHEELTATGARPRKIVRAGVEALTASERRVARMAAEGMTNKEIAQALFVTARTVESHLHHAYQKLDVSSRRELASALRREPSSQR
jgi:DNA-binding CsgD family transcriptional regulator